MISLINYDSSEGEQWGRYNLPIYIYIIYISIYQSINYLSIYLVGGTPTPLKNDGVKVSWDDYAIPNWMEK